MAKFSSIAKAVLGIAGRAIIGGCIGYIVGTVIDEVRTEMQRRKSLRSVTGPTVDTDYTDADEEVN